MTTIIRKDALCAGRWLALLLAALLALCGTCGALAEAEKVRLVDAASGDFEADMLEMLSQFSAADTEELEVRAGEETGFSAAVVTALAQRRNIALNISYRTQEGEKTLKLQSRDALLLCELDGSLSFDSAAAQLAEDSRESVEAARLRMLDAGEVLDLPIDGYIDPRIPKFMLRSIANQSGDHTVLDSAEAIRRGTVSADTFPPVRLWMDGNGDIWTLDHRRLAAFKLGGLERVPYRWATDVELANDYWKMDTLTDGESLELRLDMEGVENPVVHRDGAITGLTGPLEAAWEAALEAGDRRYGSIFDNAQINRMIDENYRKVLENGYAELRIPISLHGITEDAMTQNSLEVGRKLIENGFEAYVVGGCIRDFIMGTESLDIDITTNATLEEQQAIFGDALETHLAGGRVFGGVQFPDELVDLATFQNVPASFYGMPGVPDFDPTVQISDSALQDSFQRDLTLNAIYYDMSTGDLVDYHGGIHDIREHILNTIVSPLAALKEDPRIILRAIRFKARYGFEFDGNLDSTIREVGVELLENIDSYDFYNNINRMMVAGYAAASSRILMDCGLLDTAYPSLNRLKDDVDYLDYLDKALGYMDQLREDRGENVSRELAILAFLQPEIDRRAKRCDYRTALHGVLDEQEMAFDLSRIRDRLQSISLLTHEMEQVYSRFSQAAIRRSTDFRDALALLNMKAQSQPDDTLTGQVEFWNAPAWWADDIPEQTLAGDPDGMLGDALEEAA